MKITSERANGIKTGYWTAAKNDDLVQKLERLNDFDQAQSRKLLVKLQKAQTELDEMKRDGWISVKDRLPDDGEGVLALVSGKYGNATFESAYELAEYSKKEGWILCYFPEFADPDVSHWMPLPEPPKEDEA